MALWGKTDNLAGIPKNIARKAFFDSTAVNTTAETINLTNANTGFATGDAVFYSRNSGTAIGGLVDTTTYFVRVVGAALIELYDTYSNATAASGTTGRLNITGAGVGTHTLQHTGAANAAAGRPGIFFVDSNEATVAANKAKGLTGPGWWLYSTYTDATSKVRHKAECLIPMDHAGTTAALSGDAEDTVTIDRAITISAQPQNLSVVDGEAATFSVTATATGTGNLAYQWQLSTNDGSTWANLSSATSATLAFETVALADDGNKYRVIVSTAGAANVTSNTATLTVTEE
jgi:hypothetical protein